MRLVRVVERPTHKWPFAVQTNVLHDLWWRTRYTYRDLSSAVSTAEQLDAELNVKREPWQPLAWLRDRLLPRTRWQNYQVFM